MTRRSRIATFAALLVLHYLLTWSALLYLNDRGWDHFDHGGSPGIAERAIGAVYLVLSLPLTGLLLQLPVSRLFPGLWGHIPFLLNSSLWAGAVLWVVLRVRQRQATPR